MALEWAVLGFVAAVEAVLLILITFPGLTILRRQLIALSRAALQPMLAVVPFCFFLMLEIYWQFENMPECSGSPCNVPEQDRLTKNMMRSQRNMVLVAATLLLYWLLFRVTAILVRVEASNVQINKLKISD
ncbi:hypothetical protein M758_5G078400 [Ceratodon purpureus]|uniref:Endoplasmic reticulum transmembrane protein n=1 Tax=Ceratodon purpureus TaxID=3225 RepID=A0A8T0HZ96_CERPU|nr:hypothetical protein KC19_5G084800 [Ceratodon purpureus]KAG0615944.1 hypothetical protein M758_5G078400 [Ceratodon purpureus]